MAAASEGGAAREHVALVVIGHVDSGKSTTTGRLIVSCGGLDPRTFERFERESAELGKASFKYAWVLDQMRAERERGITIQISNWNFQTPRLEYTIIDAPGHREFVKNMISGSAQADVALLVVAAGRGEFEAGFHRNGQTREHAVLARTMGIEQIIVGVNKMDAIAYDRDRFDAIVAEVGEYLGTIGFDRERVLFIPMSGFSGDNLLELSERTPWYRGPTLLEALDAVQPPKRSTERVLRLPLIDAYRVDGVGTVLVGRVEAGVLRRGQQVVVAPSMTRGTVRSIEMHGEQVDAAGPGDNVAFSIKGVALADAGRGSVVGDAAEPPRGCRSFTAQVVVLNHPAGVRAGFMPVVDVHAAHTACEFTELLRKVDRESGEAVEEHPHSALQGETVLVRMRPARPLCVEAFRDCPGMGRFAARDMGVVVAVGVITEVEHGDWEDLGRPGPWE